MMWPFRKTSLLVDFTADQRRYITMTVDPALPGLIALATGMRRAIEAGDWRMALYGLETLERYRPDYVDPMLGAYVRAKAAAHSVYEWFEPEYGRPR